MVGYGCDCAVSSDIAAVDADAVVAGTISDGLMPSLPSVGCLLLPQPTPRPVNPLRGELLTGEPCAGEPHARFGGRRDREINRSFLPLYHAKSAVDRPWNRTFLGYSMTFHKKPRLKVSAQSLKAGLRSIFRMGRGCNIGRFIRETLNPRLRGWLNYFRLSEVKGVFELLDQWLRRRMRNLIWRQWKRPGTRRKKLMGCGLNEYHASKSAYNGRGAWWNSGASHMNAAFPRRYFDNLGIVSLLTGLRTLQKQ